MPVWAIIAAHFATNWSCYVVLTELPTFLTMALGYPVDQVRHCREIPRSFATSPVGA